MYLKKIELDGFKSFANKTSLEILPGITSIVGPNGCGKTNIVDAISWVLGEQRVRLLRGYKMEDVIFNGAVGRQSIGMAEVSLTFDNSDGKLPLEYSEVTITRRVFRSGESDYLINKKPCRLRDINELILGTGLGNRSYSLVGQGRVDQILQASPEERRGLLEEAAGISRYRSKKEEALRKLENTNNNLLRVGDIIKEVKRQLTVAERQARQAEIYRRHRDSLRELELKLSLFQLREIRREVKELDGKKLEWRGKYRSLEEEVEGVEKELLSLRGRRREKEAGLGRLRAERFAEQAEIDKAGNRLELNAERKRELQYQRERLKEEVEGAESSLVKERGELQQLQKVRDEVKKANELKSSHLEEKEKNLTAVRRELSEAEKLLSEMSSKSLEISRQDGRLRNEFSALQAGGRELVLRQKKLEVELEKVKAEEEELRGEIGDGASLLRESESRVRKLREELNLQYDVTRDVEGKVEACSRQREELSLESKEQETRRDLLEKMEPRGVNAVLKAFRENTGGLTGIIGLVAGLVEIKPGFEKAVQAVFGEVLRTLVVQDWPDAVRVLNFLRVKNAGPLRLLILEAARRPADARAALTGSASGGNSGIIEQVKLLAPLTGLEKAVFQDAVVVEDIERFWETDFVESNEILVSRDGEVLYPPGVIYWAGDQACLEKENLAEIGRKHQESRDRLQKVEVEVKEQIELLSETRERTTRIARSLQEEELKVALSRRDAERQQKNLEKASLSREAVENELSSLREEQNNMLGRKQELESRLRDSHGTDDVLEDNLRHARERAEEKARRTRLLEAEVTELKIGLASSREKEDGLDGRLDWLASEIKGLESLLEARRGQIEEGVKREEALEKESGELKSVVEEATRRAGELNRRLEVMEAEIRALNLQCEAKEKIYREVRPRFQEVQAHLSSYDVKLAEWNLKDENLCQRMREKYGVELESMEPPPGEVDREAIALEIERIRKRMESMADVNLAALEDKENYENRCKLLNDQKEDLEAARRHMEEAIKKINVTAREKLRSTYERVRENFQSLFSHLFEGGKADLLLDNEADILESGLDIVAQPPGKKLSHLSLLSGGERALTTIALIFALFKVQPSPFYILDEIDAPLDETNIGRFVKLVREMVSEAQFMIVTHNKQSISAADILYGITMEESGVSKVVSVKLGRHEEDKKSVKSPANDEPGLGPGLGSPISS